MKKIITLIAIIIFGSTVYSQTYNNFETDSITAPEPFKPSKTQFMIRGYGHTGLNTVSNDEGTESSYVGSAFAPIFLFKHSDRLIFEAELEFVLEGNELEVGLEYANVMYVLNKNMNVRAGRFLLPFGTFMERLHPSWINRFSTTPLGYGHDGIAPSSGIGVELRGAFDLGGPKLNYSVYSTNGPRLKDGSEEPEEAGMLLFQNYEDNNNSKAFGGRIGLLPFADSSTEIGFSTYSTNKAGSRDSNYRNVGAFLYALDFSFVKQIPAIAGFVDVKGQYNNSDIDDATYIEIEDDVEEEYTFDNKSNSFYAQLSYRPTMASSDFLKKLELVGRYSNFNAPEGAEWEEQSDQYAFGLNYWLTWRSVIKVAYQTTESAGGHDGGGTTDGFFIHWAIGF
ncbi:phosphate-selective porin O/P [Gillisia sp. Hel_I_86]|uniref:porin n=1 Tax=Gillisia sp. Hel_I_86 TaxID=1249981 RepID=UPI00119BBF12|nr:porin [Gillisia sp. Hel_I_86]TVZ28737.1 phosphate-selective porin O/P [Gillisia sp. Hel_I_86]